VPVCAFAESPRQLAALALDPDRIAEGDPAAAGDAVHDHALPGIAEEEGLVPEQSQIPNRFRRGRGYARGYIELPGRWHLRFRLGVPQLASQREEHQRSQDADHRSQ